MSENTQNQVTDVEQLEQFLADAEARMAEQKERVRGLFVKENTSPRDVHLVQADAASQQWLEGTLDRCLESEQERSRSNAKPAPSSPMIWAIQV